MPVDQPDLFATAGMRAPSPIPDRARPPPLIAGDLDDAALIAAIPQARPTDCHALAAEAGRRNLVAAIPALEALCRRFKGFGLQQSITEQVAALNGIAAIGGADAAAAAARMIDQAVVQGPGLVNAVNAAMRVKASLPIPVLTRLLRHAEPAIRADACHCVKPSQRQIAPTLLHLLADLHAEVATAAACALGRMGRTEARPLLLRLLREQPTSTIISAIAEISNGDVIVELGRIARANPDLAASALDALEGIDTPQSMAIVRSMRNAD